MTVTGQNRADQIIDDVVNMTSSDEPPLPIEEHRGADRLPYQGYFALILLDHSGNPSSPQLLRAADISTGGLGLISRHMFHVGSEGAVQMLRSDGCTAIVGVRVKHCQYIGDMLHRTGFEFTAKPQRIAESHFTVESGRRSLVEYLMADRKVA